METDILNFYSSDRILLTSERHLIDSHSRKNIYDFCFFLFFTPPIWELTILEIKEENKT